MFPKNCAETRGLPIRRQTPALGLAPRAPLLGAAGTQPHPGPRPVPALLPLSAPDAGAVLTLLCRALLCLGSAHKGQPQHPFLGQPPVPSRPGCPPSSPSSPGRVLRAPPSEKSLPSSWCPCHGDPTARAVSISLPRHAVPVDRQGSWPDRESPALGHRVGCPVCVPRSLRSQTRPCRCPCWARPGTDVPSSPLRLWALKLL